LVVEPVRVLEVDPFACDTSSYRGTVEALDWTVQTAMRWSRSTCPEMVVQCFDCDQVLQQEVAGIFPFGFERIEHLLYISSSVRISWIAEDIIDIC
jgi:hypothetical protein